MVPLRQCWKKMLDEKTNTNQQSVDEPLQWIVLWADPKLLPPTLFSAWGSATSKTEYQRSSKFRQWAVSPVFGLVLYVRLLPEKCPFLQPALESGKINEQRRMKTICQNNQHEENFYAAWVSLVRADTSKKPRRFSLEGLFEGWPVIVFILYLYTIKKTKHFNDFATSC